MIQPRRRCRHTSLRGPRVRTIAPGPIVGPACRPAADTRPRRAGRRPKSPASCAWTRDPRVVAELPSVRDTRTMTWDGRCRRACRRPGVYLVQVTARDRAANYGTAPAELRRCRASRAGARASPCRDRRRAPARPVTREAPGARERRRPPGRTAVSCAASARGKGWPAAAMRRPAGRVPCADRRLRPLRARVTAGRQSTGRADRGGSRAAARTCSSSCGDDVLGPTGRPGPDGCRTRWRRAAGLNWPRVLAGVPARRPRAQRRALLVHLDRSGISARTHERPRTRALRPPARV